jgi:hypothetical protein
MLLSKKIKRNQSDINDDVSVKIKSKWIAYKHRIATFLQQRSELLSTEAKKYCLAFFCLFFGGSSVAVIIYTATTQKQPLAITKISRPIQATQDQQNFLPVDSSITKQEYERVEQFKNYLLQLKHDRSSSKKFDSIIQARPHLIDSIHLFETMYLQQ